MIASVKRIELLAPFGLKLSESESESESEKGIKA